MRSIHRRCALAAATLAVALACDGGGDADDPPIPPQPELTVSWVLPVAPDPFANVDSWHVVLTSNGRVIVDRFFAPGDSPVLEDVLPQQNVVITLEGCTGVCIGASVVSRGRTLLFDITGAEQSVSMWFARAGAFSVSNGGYVARRSPSAGAFADGRVLIAGGAVDDDPSTLTDLYDPVADAVTSIGAAPSPHAGAAGVMLSSTAFLLAGGFGANGTPTGEAAVWLRDEGGAGAWRTVTPLTQSRAEMGYASLGESTAVLVGGSHGGGIRGTVEVFTWDGNMGSWVDAEPFTNQVMGPTILPMGNEALIAGGYRRNVNNGNLTFRDNVEVLRFDGVTWTMTPIGTLARPRGWGAAIPAGTNRWVLAGGLTESMANPGPPGIRTRTTDIVTWNGATTSSVEGELLPETGRRGNLVMIDGAPVLVGGDNSRLGEYPVAIDRALVVSSALTYSDFGVTPGPTTTAFSAPLPDGTTLIVTDAGVFRWNPR